MELQMLKDIISSVSGGFSPGDTCWIEIGDLKEINCDFCKSTGEVLAVVHGEKMVINCPKCRGRGKIGTFTHHPEEKRVKAVIVTVEENSEDIELQFTDSEYRLNAYECFKTIESCQEVCDKDNAEEKARRG